MKPNLKLYCITCPRKDLSYEEQAERACLGGADAVQLRDDSLTSKDVLEIGKRIKDICARHKVLFILNNRADLALALDADGVHIGQEDLPVRWARQILGSLKLVGASVSTLGEALRAEKDGASYLGLGPVFETPVKQAKKALGLELITLIKKRVKIPVVAIGGINLENVGEVLECGADGIAVIRAVCGAQDVTVAARGLKARIQASFQAHSAPAFKQRATGVGSFRDVVGR